MLQAIIRALRTKFPTFLNLKDNGDSTAGNYQEVRPTVGDDLNEGGFFTYGASGTDFSMQNSPALSNTDLVIDASDNTKVSSAGSPIGATHVGNGMQISAGSGFTPGFYRIMSQVGGLATLDRACGTTSSDGVGTFSCWWSFKHHQTGPYF